MRNQPFIIPDMQTNLMYITINTNIFNILCWKTKILQLTVCVPFTTNTAWHFWHTVEYTEQKYRG